MSGYVGKLTNLPRDVVGVQAQSEREDLWGEIPGEIVAFDAAAQTATIQPLYKPKHLGEPIDMPQLLEVPVRFQRQGGFIVTIPPKPGDKVTLRPQMRNSEKYHTEGAYEANDTRSFSLADYEAFLDGGESLQQPISGFNAENMELRNEDGSVKIEVGGDFIFMVAGGSTVRIDGSGITLVGATINMNP